MNKLATGYIISDHMTILQDAKFDPVPRPLHFVFAFVVFAVLGINAGPGTY